jgi:hypothetical protein
MKYISKTAGFLIIFIGWNLHANAESTPITSYCTRITESDKSASDGFRLTDAASILRQDRANFHKFGLRDAGDEYDSYFKSTGNRARLPEMLNNGVTENSVLQQIVHGTPYVCVNVFNGWIDVTLD